MEHAPRHAHAVGAGAVRVATLGDLLAVESDESLALRWDWYASVLTPEQRAWCAEALAPWARTDNEVPALLRREIERIEAASSEVTL